MDLIFYRGLNCHLACIINIAASLGVNYADAFASLWSETDFTDEVKYNIYVSKRVFAGLEAIGVITETLDCEETQKDAGLSRISDGELFFIGMDTFYIPWHSVFKHFHAPHYFFAQKESPHTILCFDPVYGQKDILIASSDIFTSAFDFCRVHKVTANMRKTGAADEARAVLESHPETSEKLQTEILACKNGGESNTVFLIKQITAMINNRYLFRHFLHSSASVSGCFSHLFSEDWFLKWEAVRNGLYKASVVKDNERVIDEVYGIFANLMREEIIMAKEILAIDNG